MSSALLQMMATRGAAAAAWTPANLSNKVGWWSASNLHGYSDGDPVTVWPDGFALLSDATGSGTYRNGANGIGGQPALEFDGTTNYFQTGYTGTPTDFFCAGVLTLGSVASSYERVVDKNSTTGFFVGREITNPKLTNRVLGSGNKNLDYTSPAYFFLGRSGTSAIFECNTLTRTDVTATTALSNSELVIGATYDLNALARLEGLIQFVLFLDAYPSNEDLTNLRSYITNETGIATS